MNDDDARQARLAAIRERLEAATPGPWGYNSYRAIYGPPQLVIAYDAGDAPDYPDGPRPPIGTVEDREWTTQRTAAYEADPLVAKVPAHYGDTATGRHAKDADLIANAPADLAWLLAEVERLEAERDAERHHRINLDVIVRNLTDKAGQLERALETATRSVDDWREAWEQKQVELVNVEAERDAATARAERAEALFDAVRELRNHARQRTLRGSTVYDFGGTWRMDAVIASHNAMYPTAALAEQGEG